jgi:hypothetical protein
MPAGNSQITLAYLLDTVVLGEQGKRFLSVADTSPSTICIQDDSSLLILVEEKGGWAVGGGEPGTTCQLPKSATLEVSSSPASQHLCLDADIVSMCFIDFIGRT